MGCFANLSLLIARVELKKQDEELAGDETCGRQCVAYESTFSACVCGGF